MKQGYLIPVYNHGKTACPLVGELLKQRDLPVILVDDGSDRETKECLAEILKTFPAVVLVTLDKNRGKGRALAAGMDRAWELGFTHLLQIDADGQHDPGRVPFFLDQSLEHPEAAICGYPVFDESAPASRVKGRRVANVWTRITALDGNIPDAMCGFRVYPVEPLRRLIHRYPLDSRMGADIDILVHLVWQGVPVIFHPVPVVYPRDGISHFRLIRDNIRISLVFSRLFLGLLLRLPILIFRRFRVKPRGSP
jgi:glycosyltransferase involved in cell wall biosynthesis